MIALMDLNAALQQFDITEANLRRLEAIWKEMSGLIPGGLGAPAFSDGSDPESERYRELLRAYEAIVAALPSIGDCVIAEVPWDLNAIGQARLDAMEIDEFEAKLSVEEGIQAPGRGIEEYRARLHQTRRELVCDEMTRLVGQMNGLLAGLDERVGSDNDPRDDPQWETLTQTFRQIDRLVGGSWPRKGRWSWGDMRRHLSFGQNCDLRDIVTRDWPAVRADIEKNMYSELEPLPVAVGDLGALVKAKPSGSVAVKLGWAGLTAENFERLLFNIVSDANDYANPQWLTHTNAPDQGRDISAEWISSDSLNSPKHRRVIIQAKHWQSKSVAVPDVNAAVAQVLLWEPPRVHMLVIATSGRFTADAVRWVEQHNEVGKQPIIAMWPESHLELLLAERPHLAAAYKLR
jgi:hypothetical protein